MPATTLAQESRRFGDFYVPRFEVTMHGEGLPASVMRDVVRVTYRDNIDEIDSCEITVNNWDPTTRTFKYVGAETEQTLRGSTPEALRFQLFEPGAREFELHLGYGAELTRMVRGSCTTLEPDFPAGAAPTLTVRALNVLHKLRRQQYRSHWSRKRDSEIADEIGKATDRRGRRRFPLPIRIDPTAKGKEEPIGYVAQDNQYDIDFLLQRARERGYVVYVDEEPGPGRTTTEVLYFGPSNARHPSVPAVTYELEWGISLVSFKPVLSTARQVKSVEVRSWNRETNDRIRGRATLQHRDISVNKDLLPLLDREDEGREEVVVNEPMFTDREAERRAVGILSDRLKEMVVADGTTVGLPDLRAGRRVQITGLGSRFSGIYFVTETTHTLGDDGYSTHFRARREEPLGGGGA